MNEDNSLWEAIVEMQEYGITGKVCRDNKATVPKGMPEDSSMWKVTFTRVGNDGKRRQMTVPYFMGPAHTGEPALEDVIECLIMENSYVEDCESFEEYVVGMGYEEDDEEARRTWDLMNKQYQKWRKFIS